jgi:precorrin-6Y C5,15-methyltransferase (decarboxylating)
MKRVLLFGGTAEGHQLAQQIAEAGSCCTVCVATEYAGTLLQAHPLLKIRCGRLDAAQMAELMQQNAHAGDELLVIDATHPYAIEVSRNIRQAAEEVKAVCYRLLREESVFEADGIHFVADAKEAAVYLKQTTGNVLLTTGSKELSAFTKTKEETERLYVRMLPNAEMMQAACALGILPSKLICMQGPFPKELNLALLRMHDIRVLVTKEGGSAGGLKEKLAAAKEAGIETVLITRPEKEAGMTYEEVCQKLRSDGILPADAQAVQKENPQKPVQITLAGIGMGTKQTLTKEAEDRIRNADCIIGAERMLKGLGTAHADTFASYRPEEILSFIQANPKYRKIVIALSGDSGFYSGAKRLLEVLKEYEPEVLPGISSVVYFASKLKRTWQDVYLMSTHGRTCNVVSAVYRHKKVFLLTDGAKGVRELAGELGNYGLSDVRMDVGVDLSYPSEQIFSGVPKDFTSFHAEGLCVVWIENERSGAEASYGLPDAAFQRGDVPMTKEEVRAVSLAKLRLKTDSIVYDIGAGTGSVSVECARCAYEGEVYAVEKKPDAVLLIQENARRLCAANVTVIEGGAPQALKDLPVPTHAFIGGSGGSLEGLIAALVRKNPDVHIVINAIALETVAQIQQILAKKQFALQDVVCVNVSKARTAGSYHLMTGLNPVWIVTLQGYQEEGR